MPKRHTRKRGGGLFGSSAPTDVNEGDTPKQTWGEWFSSLFKKKPVEPVDQSTQAVQSQPQPQPQAVVGGKRRKHKKTRKGGCKK